MNWEKRLLEEAEKVVRHGQGKLTMNVGPYKGDKTSVLIECGRGWRYVVDRYNEEDEE